jgi:hypothetical protein
MEYGTTAQEKLDFIVKSLHEAHHLLMDIVDDATPYDGNNEWAVIEAQIVRDIEAFLGRPQKHNEDMS